MTAHPGKAGPHHDAAIAACLLAVDPCSLGGTSIRTPYSAAVKHFLQRLQSLLLAGAPFRRMPLHIADSRLLGGLDLSATLQAGRPVLERGLLADSDGGCVILPMAERLPAATTARLCSVLDHNEVIVERDGFSRRHASRIAVVALDEGASGDERPPVALLDRLALHLDLEGADHGKDPDAPFSAGQIETARALLPEVIADDAMLQAFCRAAAMTGISSARAPIFAMKAARIHAALAGRRHVATEDAIIASRLVLAPRATVLPPSAEECPADGPDRESHREEPRSSPSELEAVEQAPAAADGELEDIILSATRAAVPADLLARLQTPAALRNPASPSGGGGALRSSVLRGRPVGSRRGELRAGARLNVVETLRAAAPWQQLRRQPSGGKRIHVRPDDFRLTQFKRRNACVTIFVVDASGSSALHRLAEAKGAAELLLSDCYVRRDQVALIAFRGKKSELILPPTRSLARAKRSLAALPGGGGTPIAHALDAAGVLAYGLHRKGLAPTIVVFTDGRANIARDGKPGSERAEADALASARLLRTAGFAALVIDIAPRPHAAAARLASDMGARYLPLPYADAKTISRAVQADSVRNLAS
jgi:magnesium chelatase subunit D